MINPSPPFVSPEPNAWTQDKDRIVLVLHEVVINPRSGAGQRTQILFSALKRCGPVTVVILSARTPTDVASFFPGAFRVVVCPSFGIQNYHVSRGTLARLAVAGLRLLSARKRYAPEPGIGTFILDQFGDPPDPSQPQGNRIVAFRYVQTFAIAGLRQDAANRLFMVVDVDDRDDHKATHNMAVRLGKRTSWLVAGWLIRNLARVLTDTLSNASLIFLAKRQDLFADCDARQIVVKNVPYHLPDPALIGPADLTDETLLYVGNAYYPPNINSILWFLSKVWPRVRAARPHARFRIVGIGNWLVVNPLVEQVGGVDIIGTVEDLAPEYAQARAAICPVHEGAGSQIKVIEACGHARPIITTKFSSTGFGPQIEAALTAATTAADFADHCIRYLADPALAAQKGQELKHLQMLDLSRAAVEGKVTSAIAAMLGRDQAALQTQDQITRAAMPQNP